MKFNKWAVAVANAVAVFYTAGALALYFWGDKALCYVEKMHMVKFSTDMVSFQPTPANYATGLISHYIVTYLFVATVIALHGRLKGK